MYKIKAVQECNFTNVSREYTLLMLRITTIPVVVV